jgi:hypothetical protein
LGETTAISKWEIVMMLASLTQNFRSRLLVISFKGVVRSILLSMGLDRVFIEFLACAAVGAAMVLLVLVFVGIGIPRRSTAAVRRTNR